MVTLSDTYSVQSNKESGYGRYDVMLIPHDSSKLGLLLEFKTMHEPNVDLKQAAMQALQQIVDRRYDLTLTQKGIRHILKIGMAFCGKQVEVLFAENSNPEILHTTKMNHPRPTLAG